MAFRALVFGSVFYHPPSRGLPLAILQPLILLFPIALSSRALSLYSSNVVAATIGGLLIIVGIETYLSLINKPLGEFRTFQLLQAFLNAWTIRITQRIWSIIEYSSEERDVSTTFHPIGDGASQMLLPSWLFPVFIQDLFYPVGSSNLPGDIYESLATKESDSA